MPRRGRRSAAQEDPHAGLQQVVGDVAVDGFVRVRDAARRVRRDKFPPVDMPAYGSAARKRCCQDGVAAFVARAYLHEVHLLAQRQRLGPAVKKRADFIRRQVAPRQFRVRARSQVRCWEPSDRPRAALAGRLPASSRCRPRRARCRSRGCPQKTVVVPLSSAPSAYAQAVIMLLSMCTCGSTSPGAMIPPRAS